MDLFKEIYEEVVWLLSVVQNPNNIIIEDYMIKDHENRLDKVLVFLIVPLHILRLIVQFVQSDTMDIGIFLVSLLVVPLTNIAGIKFVSPGIFAFLLKIAGLGGTDLKSANMRAYETVYPLLLASEIAAFIITTLFVKMQIVLIIFVLIRCIWLFVIAGKVLQARYQNDNVNLIRYYLLSGLFILVLVYIAF